MCFVAGVNKRACFRDVKRRIDSQTQTMMFMKGVSLSKNDSDSAFMVLEKSVWVQNCAGKGCATIEKMGTDWDFMGVGKNCER